MAKIVGAVHSHGFGAKFAAYFVVGGITAVVEIGTFSLFLYGAGLHYLIAGAISFVLATAFNYWMSLQYVFRSSRPRHHELMLVYFVSGVGIVVNLSVLALAIELAHLHPLIGKVAGTASAFGWNFGSRYFWVFRPVRD